MSSTRQTIFQALRDIRLIDPHSHINPHQPASKTLADILGYHYYTELVHSAGAPKHEIESSDLSPRELVGRLVEGLPHLTNTAQHAWLIDICQRFFGFQDEVIDGSNWESLYDAAEAKMQLADWAEVVLEKSNVEAVFLTNDFDDTLEGFDTRTYIPCLRTDDLVFHLSKIEVRDRLAMCSGIGVDGSLLSLRHSLEQRFEHFVSCGARACAISLPPDFSPIPVSDGRAATALEAIVRRGAAADASHKAALAKRVFWTLVELCDQYRLPMDLMIGVNRGVYAEGVHQGRDLYDSRVSLTQYRELFNAFPDVKFPISVLASVTNQELVSHAWIFPNVITNGHWWYSNTPSFIRRDASARLEAVPRNKQIGYYSDAYKLEFIAPKFDMYRNILAGILSDDFVIERGWSEEKAIELGRQILRGNVDTIFPALAADSADESQTQSRFEKIERVTSLASSGAQVISEGGDVDEEVDAVGIRQAADPYATIETDLNDRQAVPNENADPSPTEDWSASTVIEWAPTDSESIDQGEAPDPHATIGSEHDFVAESRPNETSHESNIHYFRADDEVPAEELDEDLPQGQPVGLHADPVTGELMWPVDPTDESDSSLDEPYLLRDESDSDSSESEPPQEPASIDLEDLELVPMDDEGDLDLTLLTEDDSEDAGLRDVEQRLEIDQDEQKS